MFAKAREHNPWIILIADTGVGKGLIVDLKTAGLDAIAISATQPKEASGVEWSGFEDVCSRGKIDVSYRDMDVRLRIKKRKQIVIRVATPTNCNRSSSASIPLC